MAGRDNFSAATKREIAERAGYVCSFPNCGRMTVGPSDDRASGVTMTGTAAHIVAAAAGGQRSDASLTAAQRSAAGNGIWMCAIHGKGIDDNPSIATVATLLAWKAAHEAEISAWVAHGHPGIFKSWDRLAALTRDQLETIETALPNGHAVARSGDDLVAALSAQDACLISGDSGVGKSALVKLTLDAHFSDARQVWLGPEALRSALSDAERDTLGLTAPLADLLVTSTVAHNILVLDAVERADAMTILRLSQLMGRLGQDSSSSEPRWQLIVIAQRAGFEVHLDPVVNALQGRAITILPLDADQIREALNSIPALSQHAHDDGLVTLMGNLRTLAWIIGAGSSFAGDKAGRMAARSQIADRLWAHWTGGDPDLHSFMIALARRDADYERSFALSELSATDRAAWKAGHQRLPLSLSDRNRLSFEHDLASDWARYQSLKEIAGDVARWSVLANQPLWVAALRLFGQFLLREPDQANQGWDWAFAAAQAASAPDAIDILLDALCTDRAANHFLAARTDLLFADNGRLLDRLLARFMHIATVPERSTVAAFAEPGMTLYAETELRSPIWGVWPPLIRFLVECRAAIAPFGSRTVAKICQYWLTKTPPRINGGLVLGRAGMAELALNTARVDQVRSIAYSFHGGSSDAAGGMFEAALAGAEDQLEAVSAFALEMARRQPLAAPVQAEVDKWRADERKKRKEAEGRAPRRKAPPMSMSMLGYRSLPPWPLGPIGRLNDAFRTAVLKNSALAPLMKAAPDVAAEVLLACIVDDKPHTETRGMAMDPRLGLHWTHDERPTLYWTSPFFQFLVQSPDTALDALLKLVEFCTARWKDDEEREGAGQIQLLLGDDTVRTYIGDWQVFDWSHTRRAVNSQLFAALDALERWLWMKIKAGEDVSALCADLLTRSNSAAILGVLTDCAKLDPALLRGALAPLLTSPLLILWDEYRLSHRFGNDVFTWHRAGETMRTLGLEWEQAAHRTTPLKHVIRDLRKSDPAFDREAKERFGAWPPAEGRLDLRQRALTAELDPANYHEAADEQGNLILTVRYPTDIADEIAALRSTQSGPPTLANVLRYLERVLGIDLSFDEAAELYSAFDDQDDVRQFSAIEQRIVRTAVAAVLFARAGDWLNSDPAILGRLSAALDDGVPEPSEIEQAVDGRIEVGPSLGWAMVGAMYAKALGHGRPERWDRMLSYGLATGEIAIVRTIIAAARRLKSELGASYHAVIEAAVFSAALNALIPRMDGEPGSAAAMARWRGRLARRPLAASRNPTTFDLVELAQRVERIWRSRFQRAFGKAIDATGRRNLHRRYSFGLGAHLLAATFDWALEDVSWTGEEAVPPPAADLLEHRAIVRMLWDFTDWRLRDDPYEPLEERDGFGRLDDFGLQILRTLAARIPLGNAAESRMLWEPVLALGPRGEFTVEHLIDGLFLRLYKEIDATNFIANWDAMLAFVFEPGWSEGGKFWRAREIMRRMLGLNAANQIANNPQVLAHVKDIAPYFEAFARDHLPHDEAALAAFAEFAASAAGVAIRLDAIQLIEGAISEDTSRVKGNAASALAELAQALLADHSTGLITNPDARRALNNVIGRMVRDQVPYALTLQDRARAVR